MVWWFTGWFEAIRGKRFPLYHLLHIVWGTCLKEARCLERMLLVRTLHVTHRSITSVGWIKIAIGDVEIFMRWIKMLVWRYTHIGGNQLAEGTRISMVKIHQNARVIQMIEIRWQASANCVSGIGVIFGGALSTKPPRTSSRGPILEHALCCWIDSPIVALPWTAHAWKIDINKCHLVRYVSLSGWL